MEKTDYLEHKTKKIKALGEQEVDVSVV
ncbi:hypothetical protein CCACVL1_18374 [Corchorus capsularis]|uniref:Uncharacterized protein n=1 Tax=Corchorus capsularis TaxID=210143 RepID=A0A1R3HLU2_COCAP|nr:hypothetical protein CCACVL1_18374 [Corchorus capsularis]